jgi:hypothetical protein
MRTTTSGPGGVERSCRRLGPRVALVALAVALSCPVGVGHARAAAAAPPVYVITFPAEVAYIAFLPVPGKGDLFDLDLRIEVVLPQACGDRLAGLMRREGGRPEGADVYDVVLERQPVGECKKDATRIGARYTVRMRVPEQATRELTIGARVLRVGRVGNAITVDGQAPVGDVAGAPPTAPPVLLVAGAVEGATLKTATPLMAGALAVQLEVTARWPRCAEAPLGLLGHGDASSRFVLDRFVPVARLALDGSCAGAAGAGGPGGVGGAGKGGAGRAGGAGGTIERRDLVRTTVRLPRGAQTLEITVGAKKLQVSGPAPEAR